MPFPDRKVRRFLRKLQLQRALLLHMSKSYKDGMAGAKPVRSFISRDDASGFTIAGETHA